MKINMEKLLAALLIITPIVDNINGLTMKYLDKSFIGPVFKVLVIILMSMIFLAKKNVDNKKKILYFLVVFLYFIWLTLMYSFNTYDGDNLNFSFKFIYPILYYIVLCELVSKFQIRLEKFKKYIIWMISIYSIFIYLTVVFRYQYFDYKSGYTGFVYGWNELVIAYLTGACILIKEKKFYIVLFNIIAYVVMVSKSIFIFIPVFTICYLIYHKVNIKKIILLSVFVLITGGILMYSSAYQKFYSYNSEFITNYSEIYTNDSQDFFSRLTYGRSKFLNIFFSNISLKSKEESLIGSGSKASSYVPDSTAGGTEMDPFDAFNNFGVIGLIIYIFFYIIKGLKTSKGIEKYIMLVVICFSIFGGHLFAHSTSNFVYANVIVYLWYRNKISNKSLACKHMLYNKKREVIGL
ncbi:O-antigen ligase family protein [Clostridium felsineum]|uniref:O-antigen ligase family protein n=1 Tax=Clostridium felsineum TaxID=36839 RepID=UPI00098CB99E|nr:O-antigen ligase family protein [Clostridium felsineum]URZ03538.1 hypothetical protein CLAUR_035990 [Clostridium felsineum]